MTATPIELPTCWAVDNAPDTEPAVAGSAWLSTVVVSGVMHSPCPAPSNTRPGKSQATEPPWSVARSRAPSPTAASTAPTAITRRPKRIVRADAWNEMIR